MDKLRFLIISDIHESQTNLELLIAEHSNTKFDQILICGDFMNLSEAKCLDPETKIYCIQHIDNVINQLKEAFNLTNDSIIIIPGNHDHSVFFNDFNCLAGINLHQKRVQLADGLYIIGQGGSLPAYDIETKEIAFGGFPYNNEAEFDKDFQCVLKLEKEIADNAQFIHMSHVGPSISSTSVINEANGLKIKSGSDSVNVLLEEYQKQMVFFVHGHTHEGIGIFNCGGTVVINPGSLKYNGSYAEVGIEKIKGFWRIKWTTIGYFKN